MLLPGSGVADGQASAEYQVKAAYLYNFGKFVEWPRTAFTGPSDVFKLCVLGDNPFDQELERVLAARKLQERPIRVIYPDSIAQSRKCHVLFLSTSESARMKTILAELSSDPVLTVADAPGFIDAGGMIGLIVVNESVRFEINSQPASRAGLKMSAKLLLLAKKQKR
ncbi:MAG TPA: YfiR family protein [Terriglobales bacterium]|nr:YfiR family protein [Terriglobales bacterium]